MKNNLQGRQQGKIILDNGKRQLANLMLETQLYIEDRISALTKGGKE